jgi:sortase (surface protein transpeptidase)
MTTSTMEPDRCFIGRDETERTSATIVTCSPSGSEAIGVSSPRRA